MFLYLIVGHECFELPVRDELDLLNFVRRPKAVHAMQKGHATIERRNVANDGHIMGLLDGEGAENGPAAGADQHSIGVVAVNRQGFPRQRATGHVYDGGQQFTGNFVEIGNTKKETLTGGVGCGKRAGHEGSVQCTSWT